MNNKETYNDNQDFSQIAKNWQSVLSEDEAKEKLLKSGKEASETNIENMRLLQAYPCEDNYQMGTIKDNHIYIALTNEQHNQLVDFSSMNPEKQLEHLQGKDVPITAHGGLSGFFSDQDTINACNPNGILDNAKYNEWCQIAPHRDKNTGDITYKPHVDCFEINRDKLEEYYQTRNFNAAIAKCEANNHFGCGGGNQGFNPYLNEFIGNGCLEYENKRSFSDPKLSKGHTNPNLIDNSCVSKQDYTAMMKKADMKTSDCVKNNTRHPSEVVRDIGVAHNPEPIKANTAHATLWGKYNSNVESSSVQKENSLGVGATTDSNSNMSNGSTAIPKEERALENSLGVGATVESSENPNKTALQNQQSVLGVGADKEPSLRIDMDGKNGKIIEAEQAGKNGGEWVEGALDKSAENGKAAIKKATDASVNTGMGI